MLDPLAGKLAHYMDLLSARQKLVASNIANVDTPGYKTKDVDFQFEYLSALEGSKPDVVEVQGLAVKNDGNNVNLDREARLLSETGLRFNAVQTMLKGQFRSIKSAIQEGRG